MLPKYTIEYTMHLRRPSAAMRYDIDEPVACEEFLAELLERRCRIMHIRHDGVEMPKHDFDQMIKTAAGMVAAKSICSSLGISPEEEHYRFGFSA